MTYTERIKHRSSLRFLIGLLPRIKNYYINFFICYIAKMRGATIGNNSYISLRLALSSNKNLVIGDFCNIETDNLDLREKIIIGNNVIISKGCNIIRQSHNINSEIFETIGNKLIIEDYVWITTNSLILPSCCYIKKGSVCGSGSIITKNIDEMCIVGGNPAKFLKYRESLPIQLNIPSLQGRD